MKKGYTPTGLLNNYNSIEQIQCSAIWVKGVSRHKFFDQYSALPFNITEGIVICGWRHVSCVAIIMQIWDNKELEMEAGFLTSHNKFVDRKQAAKIAMASGQITKKTKQLFSEDLY